VNILTRILFLCAAGFFAAFVDSIAGGGGIISIPAFMLSGLHPHIALGTNKFSATTGSFTSSLKFARSGKVNFKLLKFIIPFTLLGAALGVNTVLQVRQEFLSSMVFILILFVGIYSLFSKSIGLKDNFLEPTPKKIIIGIILGFSLGFYDGFFGPGTGSFLVFGLIHIFGFDFVNASGNARFLNFISNITSMVMFGIRGDISLSNGLIGNINLFYGIPVAIFMIIGARLGTRLALKKGARFIKPIFVTMSLGVAVRMLYNIFIP
jgi:uncharacterized protein